MTYIKNTSINILSGKFIKGKKEMKMDKNIIAQEKLENIRSELNSLIMIREIMDDADPTLIDDVMAEVMATNFIIETEKRVNEQGLSINQFAMLIGKSNRFVEKMFNHEMLLDLVTISTINRVLGFYTSLISASEDEAWVETNLEFDNSEKLTEYTDKNTNETISMHFNNFDMGQMITMKYKEMKMENKKLKCVKGKDYQCLYNVNGECGCSDLCTFQVSDKGEVK